MINPKFLFFQNVTFESLGGDEESYSAIGVEVTLRRKYLPMIIDYYLPSGLFVIVSWVSRWVMERLGCHVTISPSPL